MKEQDRQLFILDDQVWSSMSFEDVKDTIDDMEELGIAFPPCQYFDIMTKQIVVDRIYNRFRASGDEMHSRDPNMNIKWRFNFNKELDEFTADMLALRSNEKEWVSFLADKRNKRPVEDNARDVEKMAQWVLAFMLVALIAKNSEKTVKENKLAKLGIGKKNPKNMYKYTTTVTIGKITETIGTGDSTKGGWKVRPHLRRGHIREQKFGPNNQYSKKVFIQPIFVNAAEGYVNNRTAYNVRVA